MADNGMIVTRYTHGNAEIVVYRPVLDEKERAKREAEIIRALEDFGKWRVRQRMEGKDVTG